jgi:hypothetical protein
MFGAEFVPKRKILKGFPKETIELSEEQPKPADIK